MKYKYEIYYLGNLVGIFNAKSETEAVFLAMQKKFGRREDVSLNNFFAVPIDEEPIDEEPIEVEEWPEEKLNGLLNKCELAYWLGVFA